MAPISTPTTPKTVIAPSHGWVSLRLGELWTYRELLYFLTWRDVMVRYKQAALGVGWAILQPLLTMAIFSVIFGRFARLPSEGVPYPLFVFAALLPWQLFSQAFGRAGASVVSNANLLTKVYFPRLVIPIAAVGAGLLDFVISMVVLAGLMLYYGVQPTAALLWLPALVALTLIAALGVGLWLAALNVHYRDVQHIIPFLVQVWMYASPVAYSTELIPEGLARVLYGLNPMAGIVQAFRWALLGTTPPDGMMIVSVLVTVGLLGTGLAYFRQMERTFADVV